MAGGAIPRERSGGEPLQDWMIAVIAGVAGVLLLAIVVLALCCFKRRKKARGGKNILTIQGLKTTFIHVRVVTTLFRPKIMSIPLKMPKRTLWFMKPRFM